MNQPRHYDGKTVNADEAMASMLGADGATDGLRPMCIVWWSLTFKYLWRWSRKNGMDDLMKAEDCLHRLMAEHGMTRYSTDDETPATPQGALRRSQEVGTCRG